MMMSNDSGVLQENSAGANVAVFATDEIARALISVLDADHSASIRLLGWPVSEVSLQQHNVSSPPDLVVCEIRDAAHAVDCRQQLHRYWPEALVVSCEQVSRNADGEVVRITGGKADAGQGFLEEASRQAGWHGHVTATEAALHLPVFLRYARQRRQAEMRLARMERLYNAFSSIVISLDLQRVAAAIIDEFSRWISAESWLLYTLSDDGQSLELTLAEGIRVRPHSMRLSLQTAEKTASPLTRNVAQATAQREEEMNTNHLPATTHAESHADPTSAGSESPGCQPFSNSTSDRVADRTDLSPANRQVLCLPLKVENQVIGLIEAVQQVPAEQKTSESNRKGFTDLDEQMLNELTRIASVALNNALRFERAERMYMQDDLTTLHNSRFLRQYVDREVKRAKRYGSRFAALFIDLDGFKGVNDRFGHRVGSDTLCEMALLLNAQVRETDIVARYGGDEFTIILPETDAEKALVTAERIRRCVEAKEFITGRGESFQLTVSIGVAAFPDHAQSATELLEKADFAMYEAKAANKNNVRLAS